MSTTLDRTVQLSKFGDPDGLRIVGIPLPDPGPDEVRVRVLASSLNYTDVLIRKHLYPQTAARHVPFVMGYDVVGVIDRLGAGVTGFKIGDRVADMTVVGSNADYRILRASDLTLVPDGVDPAEAATLILSWTTAYQMLHRAGRVQRGQRILIHGAAGAVGQAQIQLGKLAGFQMWGAANGRHADLVRDLGATPIDYERADFTRAVPGGFDVVFDGIGEDGYRHSFAALKPGGLLIAIGYSAGVQAKQGMLKTLASIGRMYLWGLLPGGKRTRFYSINVMRARHPDWFKEDLAHLFDLLKRGVIHPRVAERISFDKVADAHRRLEAGGSTARSCSARSSASYFFPSSRQLFSWISTPCFLAALLIRLQASSRSLSLTPSTWLKRAIALRTWSASLSGSFRSLGKA
jgi:NADPH:quinone reductase-like Zn-dependent oxidoreductase